MARSGLARVARFPRCRAGMRAARPLDDFAHASPNRSRNASCRLHMGPSRIDAQCTDNQRLLDLFAEDSWRRVYGSELEVRPPGAPTTGTGGTNAHRNTH